LANNETVFLAIRGSLKIYPNSMKTNAHQHVVGVRNKSIQ